MRPRALKGPRWGSRCCWHPLDLQGSEPEQKPPGFHHSRCSSVGSDSRLVRIESRPGQHAFVRLVSITTDLAVLGQINLQGLGVILKTKRGHCKQNILAVDSLALFLLALLRGYRWSISPGAWAQAYQRD